MLKAFLRDSAIYGVLRALTSSVAVLLLPLYTRQLRPAEYGLVDLLTISATIVATLVTLEIAQGVARFHGLAATEEARVAYVSSAFWFTAGSFAAFALLVAAGAPWISGFLAGDASHAGSVRAAAISAAVSALLYVVLTDLRYALRRWSYAATTLLFTLVAVGATSFYLIVMKLGVTGVFLGQLTAGSCALALGAWLARNDIRLVFDGRRLREMLGFSAPLVISSIAVLAAAYADRFGVRALLSIDALGVYAVGARIASAVMLAMAAFQMALSPLIYRHHRDPGAAGEIERILRWFVAAAGTALLVMAIFARDALALLATVEYAGAEEVIFLVSLAAVIGNLYLFAPGLWIANKSGTIAAINVGAAALNTILVFSLVPLLGIRGSAIGTCIGNSIAVAVHLILGQPHYRVPFQWARLGAGSALVIVTGLFFARFPELVSAMGLVGNTILLIALTISLLFIMLGSAEMRALARHWRNSAGRLSSSAR